MGGDDVWALENLLLQYFSTLGFWAGVTSTTAFLMVSLVYLVGDDVTIVKAWSCFLAMAFEVWEEILAITGSLAPVTINVGSFFFVVVLEVIKEAIGAGGSLTAGGYKR